MRAVFGAALIAVAAFGVVFAHRAAQRSPTQRYVVVTSEVPAGTELEASKLGTVALELPSGIDAVRAERADEVIGRLAGRTIAGSTLLSEADLVDPDRFVDPAETEVAISLDPERTPLGQFGVGDHVALFATDETGTEALAERARVTRLDSEESGAIGSGSSVRVGLALERRETAEAVIDAAVNSELTVALGAPEPTETP